MQTADENERFWIASLQLFLGVLQGTRDSRTGYWLRWWDEGGNLLLWGAELAEQEGIRAQQAESELLQERQRAEQAESELEELRKRLRKAGIDPI